MAEVSCAGRIVVGVDGSPGSRWALASAAGLARRDGVGLDVIAVWDFTTWWGITPVPPNYSARDDMEKAVRDAVDEVLWTARPSKLRIILRQGDPAEALIEKSRDALLVVVGPSAHRGLHRVMRGLVHGSVSSRVAARAACPVLVARPPLVPDTPAPEFVGELNPGR